MLSYRRVSGCCFLPVVTSFHDPRPSPERLHFPTFGILNSLDTLYFFFPCYWNRICVSLQPVHPCTTQASLQHSIPLFAFARCMACTIDLFPFILPFYPPSHPPGRTLHELSHRRFCISTPFTPTSTLYERGQARSSRAACYLLHPICSLTSVGGKGFSVAPITNRKRFITHHAPNDTPHGEPSVWKLNFSDWEPRPDDGTYSHYRHYRGPDFINGRSPPEIVPEPDSRNHRKPPETLWRS